MEVISSRRLVRSALPVVGLASPLRATFDAWGLGHIPESPKGV